MQTFQAQCYVRGCRWMPRRWIDRKDALAERDEHVTEAHNDDGGAVLRRPHHATNPDHGRRQQ